MDNGERDDREDTLTGVDARPFAAVDLRIAASLLVRAPIWPPAPGAYGRSAHAVWAYPIIGALVGALAGAVYWLLNSAGLATGPSAAIALSLQVAMTGALHEDGLSDVADGLFGGWTAERRLEIMRDSRIGAFGACALVLVLLTRWSLMAEVPPMAAIGVFAAVGAISRANLGAMMRWVPPARRDGLSAGVGRPPTISALAGPGLALAFSLVVLGPAGIAAFAAAAALCLIMAMIALRKIGGQTGDVLGGAQQMGEVAALAVLIAAMAAP